MKAIAPLLLALILAQLSVFSLGAQENSNTTTADAVSRLEASKTFGVAPAPAVPAVNRPAVFNGVTSDRPDIDLSRVLDMNPTQKPIFDAPPPEVLQSQQPQPQRPVRRYDANVNNKDADWLLKGVEEQRKLMEQQEKALNKDSAVNSMTEDPLKRDGKNDSTQRDKDKDKNSNSTAKSSITNSNPLNTLGVYSRYTVGGLDSIKTANGVVDPLSVDSLDKHSSLKSNLAAGSDPVTAPLDATKINAPIIDPLSMVKLETTAPANNSRLNVNDWLANVKEKERASLLPQQAPNIQDLYDKNQVRPAANDSLPKPKPLVDARPKADTLKNSLPPNRTIKDPNDF